MLGAMRPRTHGRARAALFPITAALLLSAAIAPRAARAEAPPPWEAQPFTASATAVLEAARAVTLTGDVVTLLEEGRFTFDASGRREYVYRHVYRIDAAEAVEGWSSVESGYAPWYQERPRVRVRVVTADGRSHDLDPRTLVDAPAGDESRDIYSNRRVVRAPIPAIAAGAVVEEEVLVRDAAPRFTAGDRSQFYFARIRPSLRTRLIVEAPTSLPLRCERLLLDHLEPRRTEEAGLLRLVFEEGPTERAPRVEPDLPPETTRYPQVVMATGRSWRDVATAYAATVAAAIADAPVEAMVKEATLGLTGRDEKAAACLARLHREVRYTGVELDDATIVPRTPAETLARRYGDCKDQAALLIAMLREAGIPASAVLLRAGGLEDLAAPALPGLGGFDHVIVRVDGERPLWIDPTDPSSAAGELPTVDQGRLALVAAPGTDGLVRTPEPTAALNTVLETREVRLSEEGPGAVVETTRTTGAPARGYRRGYRDLERRKIDEKLRGYGRAEYGAATVTALAFTDPRDMAGPYELRIAFEGATKLATDDEAGAIEIDPAQTLGRLPEALQQAIDPKDPPSSRKGDLFVHEPHSYEVRWRITPPPGYRIVAPPDAVGLEWGPARFGRSVRALEDGRVEVDLRFSLDRRRLTPAEAEAVRAGAAALRAEGTLALRFEHEGARLLAAGRPAEGLAALRRVEAERPKDARPSIRRAKALMALGLGEAARAAAREAVARDPEGSLAWTTLAWTLQHDLVGRLRQGDYDVEGAAAAYRRASALAPLELVPRGDLAILLEHDPETGIRYGPGARLGEAIDAYRAIRADLKTGDLEWNLCLALFWADRIPELRATLDAREKERGELGAGEHPLDFAVRAVLDGPEECLRHVARTMRDAGKRRDALAASAQMLAQSRRYPLALALVREAAKGAPNAAAYEAWATSLSRVRRRDVATLGPADPASVYLRFLLAASLGVRGDALRALFTPEVSRALLTDEGLDEIERGFRRGLVRNADKLGPDPGLAVDSILSNARITREGDMKLGYHVSVAPEGMPPQGAYIVRRGKEMRIVALDGGPGALGLEAIARAAAGDLAGARHALDHARARIEAVTRDDALALEPFPHLWTKGEAGDGSRIRRAAAALCARDAPKDATAVLEAERPGAEGREARLLDLALAQAYLVEQDGARLLPVVERLRAEAPDSVMGAIMYGAALGDLGRFPEALTVVATALAAHPDDRGLRSTFIGLHADAGEREEAVRLLAAWIATGRATPGAENQLAWSRLTLGRVGDEDIAAARRAVAGASAGMAAYAARHTLAALYAERGQVREAGETLVEGIEGSGGARPRPLDWYVLGRMAEQVGETEAAVLAYRRVTPSKEDPDRPGSCNDLARRRLKVLGAGAPEER